MKAIKIRIFNRRLVFLIRSFHKAIRISIIYCFHFSLPLIFNIYLNDPQGKEKNGRTKEELNQVIEWLTGFNENELQALIENKVTFRTFFKKAKIHSNAKLIKGVVCGYRIEEIEDEFELYKQCRRMEKLIDELARGRKMEKVLRK